MDGVEEVVKGVGNANALSQASIFSEVGAQPDCAAHSEFKEALEDGPKPVIPPLLPVVGFIAVFVIEIRVYPSQGGAGAKLQVGPEVILDILFPYSPLYTHADRHSEEVVGFIRYEALPEAQEANLAIAFLAADREFRNERVFAIDGAGHISTQPKSAVCYNHL